MKAITGIPDNLFSTIIEVSAFLVLGIGLLLWKTIATSETTRIDNSNFEIPDSLIVSVDPNTSVEISFDWRKHYTCPPMVETCLRWVELDREDFFLVEAGALDIPKLTLLTATYDNATKTLQLELGSSSFFDIFYTHYSPDLVLSSQSATEKNDSISLRSIFGTSIFKYYKEQVNSQWQNGKALRCSNLLPNPLGISGIVLLSTASCTYVLLRKRGSHEIAARNRLEWSFAGLVEATEWIHVSKIDFIDFATSEFKDEVVSNATILEKFKSEIEPIGFVFNPLYLYQPEIFVAVKYATIPDEVIAQLTNMIRGVFVLVPIDQLSKEFAKYELKNLCWPGVRLLQSAYPTLFRSPKSSRRPVAPTNSAPVS